MQEVIGHPVTGKDCFPFGVVAHLTVINSFNALVMELVYVLVLEAKFCEFESHPVHHSFNQRK